LSVATDSMGQVPGSARGKHGSRAAMRDIIRAIMPSSWPSPRQASIITALNGEEALFARVECCERACRLAVDLCDQGFGYVAIAHDRTASWTTTCRRRAVELE
jgi:hypothetical protein